MSVYEGPLGMIPPADNRHHMKYALTGPTLPAKPTAPILGIPWYTNFDRPSEPDRQGKQWIGKGDWGTVRGGHAIPIKPPSLKDLDSWHRHYDQGVEGACTGFAVSRSQSLNNRKMYDGFALYHEAQKNDAWPGEDYEGTETRAALWVAKEEGMWLKNGKGPIPREGILVYRWTYTIEDIAFCLDPASRGKKVLDEGCVPMLNSWGDRYPHYVWMDLNGIYRLVREGECGVATDR